MTTTTFLIANKHFLPKVRKLPCTLLKYQV